MPNLLETRGPMAIIGTSWGDEGKGGKADYLAQNAIIVARYSGGDNAGHTVTAKGRELKLHLIPSGILNPGVICVVGNEVVVNPLTLKDEIVALRKKSIDVDPARFLVDEQAQLIMRWHRMRDGLHEAARAKTGGEIGTTGRGIGPAYADRAARVGLRVKDLLAPNFESLFLAELQRQERIIREMQGESFASDLIARLTGDETKEELLQLLQQTVTPDPFDERALLEQLYAAREVIFPLVTNTVPIVCRAVDERQKVIFEGAQGVLLDLTHGTLPYVTSSHPGIAGIAIGYGGSVVKRLETIVGVAKSFATRVGEGPMPTEQFDEVAARLRGTGENPWDEYGTTTGRPRRCGWLDIPLLNFGIRMGGVDSLAVTKMDILAGIDPVPICVAYVVGDTKYTKPSTLDMSFLSQAEPVYEFLGGWEMPGHPIQTEADIPSNARAYLRRIEELTRCPVKLASFGPDRENNVLY